jgi:transcriptional regulator with XRE-family HTH domain
LSRDSAGHWSGIRSGLDERWLRGGLRKGELNVGLPSTLGSKPPVSAVGWGVWELAKKAGVTANTVTRIENGADAKQSTMDRLQEALEAAGVQFIDERRRGGGPATKAEERLGPAAGPSHAVSGPDLQAGIAERTHFGQSLGQKRAAQDYSLEGQG